LKQVAGYLFSKHSYEFKNFNESITKYTFCINNEEKYLIFCQMTLLVISHNLSANEWSELCICLQDLLKANFKIKDYNDLDEYRALRVYINKMYYNVDVEVAKRESPDFTIILPDKTNIGVEITKFINELDAIVYKISQENFGRGKTLTEVQHHAKSKYPKKYEKLFIQALNSKKDKSYISKKQLTNITSEHYENAQKILSKYEKFKEWNKNESFNSRIILCVAYSPINFTRELDLVEISNVLFTQNFCMDCKVVIFSYLDGINGFWGIIDLKNKNMSYEPCHE
jgi:hypothetical protein